MDLAIEKGFKTKHHVGKYLNLIALLKIHTWLREEHNIVVTPKHNTFNQRFGYFITGGYTAETNGILKSYDFKTFDSYEEALTEGLSEGIKFIK